MEMVRFTENHPRRELQQLIFPSYLRADQSEKQQKADVNLEHSQLTRNAEICLDPGDENYDQKN